MMPPLIEEISRIVLCGRCYSFGLRLTCVTDGLELLVCPEPFDHDFDEDECPDCEGKGWMDLDEIY